MWGSGGISCTKSPRFWRVVLLDIESKSSINRILGQDVGRCDTRLAHEEIPDSLLIESPGPKK